MADIFRYQNIQELREDISRRNLPIEVADNLTPLSRPVNIGHMTSANSMADLPMEGCDSNLDGSPSELVFRRYHRFADGGAGLIWCEANAVLPEGRANERQMMLTRSNIASFQDLVSSSKRVGLERNGFEPIMILQLTHSGRYSRPSGHVPCPLIPQRDPILDARSGVLDESSVVSDEYLEGLVPSYVQSALLAKEAGFDGVDIKACHRYLLSELLASHTRPGKFGGSFENRSRLILTIVEEVRKAVGDEFILASRFNVFDAHPYPYGFGCSKDDMWVFDPTEPVQLVKELVKRGVNLLSNSAGNPYYIYPQVTRPFDTSSMGIPTPEEHQLVSIARLFDFSRTVQEAAGKVPVIGNGYTWLRQFLPNVGAANLAACHVKMIGLGRSSFAYPEAPRDILETGKMDAKKVCISCSKCTQIMRDHGTTGCVVRDAKLYAPLAKQFRQETEEREA